MNASVILPFSAGEPADRLALPNWAAAGLLPEGGIPAFPRLTISATIAAATYGNGASDSRAGIQTALDACPSGQTVLLGAGLFRVDDYIKIPSNVTLRGSGAGVTTLRNVNGGVRADTDLPTASGNSLGLVQIGNSLFPKWSNTGLLTLTANAVKGAYSCTVDSVSGLSVGQYVLVSEDQFFTGGAWTTKPLSSGVANLYEKWATDRVTWARDRLLGTPVTITSSNAGDDRFTLSRSDLVFPAGGLTYLTGHSGTLSPTDPDGYYRILDQPTANTVRLQTQAWSSTLVDVTAGGTGGTLTVNPPGEYQAAGGTIPPDSGWLTWHSRGYGHVYGETKRITGISGLTVTFESPFCATYRVSQLAQIAVNDTTFVEHAGLENMTLHRGSNGAVRMLASAKCWVYNCDIYEWIGHGIHIEKSYRNHIEGCTVRYATWRQPGGGSYAIAIYEQSAEVLVQNSIFVDSNKNIAVNAAGAGCVFAYNHCDDSLIYSDLTWQETGVNGSHFGGSHHMLMEGNYAPNGDSDNTHGSSHAHTFHRNWFSGQRASFTDSKNVRCLGFGYGTRDMSATGNVFGREGLMSGWALAPTAFTDPTNPPMIYKFGYDPGDWNQAYDPNVRTTFYEGNNWNWLNSAINVAETTTPNSRYLSAAPSWFGAQVWPWVTPTAATKTNRLPAKYRYEQGQWNDLTLTGPGAGPVLQASTVNNGSDTTPTVSHTATSGRTLVMWVTITGVATTITGPSGWMAGSNLTVFSNFSARMFYKIASGSDSYACSLASSEAWTVAVTEWSSMPATVTLRTSAQQEQNSTTPESGATGSASVSGDLVISTLVDSSSTAFTAPSGYTGILPAPGGVLHYGTAFLIQGAMAWKTATGATENPAWTRDSSFSGVGVYVFSGS